MPPKATWKDHMALRRGLTHRIDLGSIAPHYYFCATNLIFVATSEIGDISVHHLQRRVDGMHPVVGYYCSVWLLVV